MPSEKQFSSPENISISTRHALIKPEGVCVCDIKGENLLLEKLSYKQWSCILYYSARSKSTKYQHNRYVWAIVECEN